MTTFAILGWSFLWVYTFIALSILIAGRKATGERAMGLVIPIIMMPVIALFAIALGLLQYWGSTIGVAITSILLILPMLLFSPQLLKRVIMLFYQTGRR